MASKLDHNGPQARNRTGNEVNTSVSSPAATSTPVPRPRTTRASSMTPNGQTTPTVTMSNACQVAVTGSPVNGASAATTAWNPPG